MHGRQAYACACSERESVANVRLCEPENRGTSTYACERSERESVANVRRAVRVRFQVCATQPEGGGNLTWLQAHSMSAFRMEVFGEACKQRFDEYATECGKGILVGANSANDMSLCKSTCTGFGGMHVLSRAHATHWQTRPYEATHVSVKSTCLVPGTRNPLAGMAI
jgi:hypothetical protein